MKRIVVMGPSGAGKSPLARRLGEKLSLPVLHLDALFFEQRRAEIEKVEFLEKIEAILSENEHWIIEGNYSDTLPLHLETCDQVFFWTIRVCVIVLEY